MSCLPLLKLVDSNSKQYERHSIEARVPHEQKLEKISIHIVEKLFGKQ